MLKRLSVLICLSILFPIHSYAQSEGTSKKSKLSLSQLYLKGGTGYDLVINNGNAIVFGAGLTLSNHWGVSVGYHNNIFNASNLPADYYPGASSWGVKWTPFDRIQYWSYCVAREMFVNKNGTIRLGLEAGPSKVTLDYNTFDPDPTYTGKPTYGMIGGWSVSSNYTYQEHRTTGYGMTLKARAQVVSRVVGAEVAIFGNISSLKSIYGLEASFMLGRLRNKIPPGRRQIIKAMNNE